MCFPKPTHFTNITGHITLFESHISISTIFSKLFCLLYSWELFTNLQQTLIHVSKNLKSEGKAWTCWNLNENLSKILAQNGTNVTRSSASFKNLRYFVPILQSSMECIFQLAVLQDMFIFWQSGLPGSDGKHQHNCSLIHSGTPPSGTSNRGRAICHFEDGQFGTLSLYTIFIVAAWPIAVPVSRHQGSTPVWLCIFTQHRAAKFTVRYNPHHPLAELLITIPLS